MKSLAKLATINDNFTVNMYDNGFMVEVTGSDSNDDWTTIKTIANTRDDLIELIDAIIAIPRRT